MDVGEPLQSASLAIVARSTFPAAKLPEIVAPVAGGDKQIAAYCLDEGKTLQAENRESAKLYGGNLSEPISRVDDASWWWISARISSRCTCVLSRKAARKRRWQER